MTAPGGAAAPSLARLRALVAAAPNHPAAHYNLGVRLHEMNDAAGAAAAFSRAVRLKGDFFQAWNNLGLALEDLHRSQEATAAYRRALQLRSDYPAALKNLGRLAAQTGDMDIARTSYRRLVELDPENWSAVLAGALLLPPVYESVEALAQERKRYSDELAVLLQRAERAETRGGAQRRLAALDRHSNFFLAYQGEDDKALQESYSDLVRRLLADDVPVPMKAAAAGRGQRLRVAFASCFFRDCTVGHYFKSWITDLDPHRFEVWVFLLSGPEDAVTEAICQSAHRVVRATGSLVQTAHAIREAAPDVLVYPELGMNGRTHALAALRIAPVQCAGWGHPVTSGHANVDYYLSCAAMEPRDAQAHYTESLVGLPGLGTRYAMPDVGCSLNRSDLGLPEGAHLYFFPHAPYKVHPENDALLAGILAADPDGLLVLCRGFAPAHSDLLRRRLEAAMAARGVAAGRLHMLPHLPRASFLEAGRLCDVFLDATRWSGGNTSLDALAAGLPIVTRWGRFMRGRQSAGMLRLMGLEELIAQDDEAYVALALKLGRDRAWRDRMSGRIIEARSRLFNDASPIAAFEEFLLSL